MQSEVYTPCSPTLLGDPHSKRFFFGPPPPPHFHHHRGCFDGAAAALHHPHQHQHHRQRRPVEAFDNSFARGELDRIEITSAAPSTNKKATTTQKMPSPSSPPSSPSPASQYHIVVGNHNIIDEPHENDVLMGRGGKNNQHSGNEKLRQIARAYCVQYYESSKKEKSNISRLLVDCMRDLDPPSRFLKRNALTGKWEDVGDDVAREKASQVLRDAVALVFEEEGGGQTDHPPRPPRPAPPPTVTDDGPSSSWGTEDGDTVAPPPDRLVSSSQSHSDETPGLHSDSSHPNCRRRPTPTSSNSDGGAARTNKRPRSHPPSSRSWEDDEDRPLYRYGRPPSPVVRQRYDHDGAVFYPPSASNTHPRPGYNHPHHHSQPQYPHQYPYSYSHHHHYPPGYAVATAVPSRPPPVHRRRSSATDGSLPLPGDCPDFDLFNGQLLESDSEDRGY